MKIAYFTDSFLPSVSGIVASVVNITEGLSAKNRIFIIAPKKNKFTQNVFKKSQVRILYLPSLPIFFNPNLRVASPVTLKMFNALREFDPDVIHFHTPFLLGAGSIILGRLLKKPVVGTFHSYFMEQEYLNSIGLKDKNHMISAGLWSYASAFYDQCDAIITPTAVARADLLKHVKSKSVHIIPNSIHEKAVHELGPNQVAALKKKHKLKENVILYVGRLSLEKSVNILIKTLPYIIKKFPQTSLFIVGNGPQRKKLTRLARRLKLTSHVVFAGEVAQEKLLGGGYFQVANVFATASPSETQGISLLEAMRFGLPLVGVDKKGVAELLTEVGLLSPVKDVERIAQNIIKILEDPSLAKTLSARSKAEFSNKYTRSTIIEKHQNLYKKVIREYTTRSKV